MLKRVTFITAAALLALLTAGCVKTLDSAPGRNEAIRFGAGSSLLLEDGLTRAEIREGASFSNGDAFTVFGTRNSGDSQSTIFNGVEVTKGSFGWTYPSPKFWYWTSSSDYYDFVAVWPSGKGTEKMDISGNLAVSTHYDIMAGDNYDMMAAVNRRRGNVSNPSDTVRMSFSHLGCAVRVVVINNSENKDVTLDSVKFKNLVVCGDAKVSLDLYGQPSLSWINTERNPADVFKTEMDMGVPHGTRDSSSFFVMIPQRLDQAATSVSTDENMPRLILKYTPQGVVQSTANICLKDVTRQDGTVITSWETGVKYTYYVNMRLDGGALVSIVTTAWDPVDAETPGLLID